MNRLVIIGNGFDLAHGLKTKYEQFIRWYLGDFFRKLFDTKEEISHHNDGLLNIKLLSKQPFTFHFQNSTFVCSAKAAFCNNNEIDSLEFLLKLENNIKNIRSSYVNKSFFLDRILKNIETKGWTDIESDYYALLKENADNIDVCKNLNEQMDFLRNKLAEYLKTLTFKNRIDSIGLIFKSGIKEEDVAISSMKRFDKEVSSYERNIFRPCGEGIVDKTIVLDFNYTDTVLNYVPLSCENHIHGCLDNPNSMIFGYGDEMDKEFELLESRNENELLKNSKSIKYIEADNYRNLLEFIESDIFQVFIMGHSCGNSDRTLLHTIFEHENCISIKPFYYKWGEKEGEDTYSEITRNIYRNFKDKTLFRDRVVNKTHCEPMPQVKIKKTE